jgi:hypothetical protein
MDARGNVAVRAAHGNRRRHVAGSAPHAASSPGSGEVQSGRAASRPRGPEYVASEYSFRPRLRTTTLPTIAGSQASARSIGSVRRRGDRRRCRACVRFSNRTSPTIPANGLAGHGGAQRCPPIPGSQRRRGGPPRRLRPGRPSSSSTPSVRKCEGTFLRRDDTCGCPTILTTPGASVPAPAAAVRPPKSPLRRMTIVRTDAFRDCGSHVERLDVLFFPTIRAIGLNGRVAARSRR